MTNKTSETITFIPEVAYDRIDIPDEYRDPSKPKDTTPFNAIDHMYVPDAPVKEVDPSYEKQLHREEVRRKIGKITLRSLETAFNIMAIAQGGVRVASVIDQLTHEHPAVTAVDDSKSFSMAIEESRENHFQNSMDALAGIEADNQAESHAVYQDTDTHSTSLDI